MGYSILFMLVLGSGKGTCIFGGVEGFSGMEKDL